MSGLEWEKLKWKEEESYRYQSQISNPQTQRQPEKEIASRSFVFPQQNRLLDRNSKHLSSSINSRSMIRRCTYT